MLIVFGSILLLSKIDTDIHVLPPPLFIPEFEITENFSLREENHIVFLGNLLQHKNVLQLLEAIKHLTKYNLTIIGSGNLESEISDYIEENNLHDRVKIAGFLPDNLVTEILLSADIFCAPSIYEPFGLVYIEALAHGLPVIGYGPSINEIEDYIKTNQDFKPELGYAVRVDSFAESSIDMYVRCFTKTDDWDEWLAVKERLAISIKQIVEKNNASFAFPSQSIYVEKK